MNGYYLNLWGYSQSCRPGVSVKDLAQFGCTAVEQMPHDPNFGFISYEPDRIVFAFQGSVNSGDWGEDLRGLLDIVGDLMLATDFKGDDVYPGFAQAFEPFKPRIVEVAAQNPAMKFMSIGHSLGAAMACLCTAFLHDMGYKVEGVGYGSPMPYNQQGAVAFGAKNIDWTKIRNGQDLVCDLPPLICKPVGKEVVIPEPDTIWPWTRIEEHLQYLPALQKSNI